MISQIIDLIWLIIVHLATRAGLFFVFGLSIILVIQIINIIVIKYGKRFFSLSRSLLKSIAIAVSHNEDVQKYINQHQRFFTFLEKRFSKRQFSGLPLTLFLLLFLYILFLLGGVVENIVKLNTIATADTRVMNLFSIFRSDNFNEFFLWITMLGKWEVVFGFFAALTIIFWLCKRYFYIFPLSISILICQALSMLGKFIIHRPRPELAYYYEKSFSFPSSHSAIAVAFYGFLAYTLIRNSSRWRSKVNIFFFGLLIILLIGFSRIYFGVHYLSDVWGGFLLGGLCLMIGVSLTEWQRTKMKNKNLPRLNKKQKLVTLIIIILSLLFYFVFSYYNLPQPIHAKDQEKTIVVTDAFEIFLNDQIKFTETLFGNKQEPISFIIVAKDDDEFLKTFKSAGWDLADMPSFASMNMVYQAVIFKKPYPCAPITPSFWNASVNTYGFEKETEVESPRQRHHARFWKTDSLMKNGKNIYIGTASLDIGIKWGITHRIAPDIDTEREYLFNTLKSTKKIIKFQKKQITNPVLGKNFTGDTFFTDGETYLIEI